MPTKIAHEERPPATRKRPDKDPAMHYIEAHTPQDVLDQGTDQVDRMIGQGYEIDDEQTGAQRSKYVTVMKKPLSEVQADRARRTAEFKAYASGAVSSALSDINSRDEHASIVDLETPAQRAAREDDDD